jgi:putative PIN family toxin of toxin-antitoxin system
MRLVIDTNLMLRMVSSRSDDHCLFKLLLEAEHTLLVTTEILEEYEEIAGQYLHDKELVEDIMQVILNLPSLEYVTVHYQWELIKVDRDDNKFVDCAINANADCIITEDKHFKVLNNIDFPKVIPYRINELKRLLYG